jgi:hypothetical protein
VFSGVLDPWGNLWWVYVHSGTTWEPAADSDWGADQSESSDEAWDQDSPDQRYIHDTLLSTMSRLRDPRDTGTRVG